LLLLSRIGTTNAAESSDVLLPRRADCCTPGRFGSLAVSSTPLVLDHWGTLGETR
jgi:hypothetical protein